ncbi:PadR family transcriptional regulator [Kocuria sp.]|uniref:PadR family transcriptional regulator n=1 Tax=Kocuria sp. TaxID=1871328 RepID=UPI0026DF2647|nr:PadR family transcriptional regulator [Kocuria sp.]MDO5368523.1 PadR family transcriptional regulator [Kocuria sp.]
MSLRMSLLALLTAGPMTGYDVAKQFHGSVGSLWHAPDSQIYPELKRMRTEGLLSTRQVPWGTRGNTKTEYQVTEVGVRALSRWLEDELAFPPTRHVHRLRAAYLEFASPEAARAQFLAHREHFRQLRQQALERIHALEERRSATLVRRLAHSSPEEQERLIRFKVHAHRGEVAAADTEIAWAEEGLALVEELFGAGPPPMGRPRTPYLADQSAL